MEKIFEEIMDEKSPNLMEAMNTQIQEAIGTPSTKHIKITTLRYMIVNLLKTSDQEKNLKIS